MTAKTRKVRKVDKYGKKLRKAKPIMPSPWICSNCGKDNRCVRQICLSCKEPRPDEKKKRKAWKRFSPKFREGERAILCPCGCKSRMPVDLLKKKKAGMVVPKCRTTIRYSRAAQKWTYVEGAKKDGREKAQG